MSGINNKLNELGYESLYHGEKNDPDNLANFTQKLGYKVPEDYQKFLLDYPNTGTFQYSVILPVDEYIPAAKISHCLPLSLLYSSCSTESSYHLLNERELEILPPDLIIIGADVGGNYFCLNLDDKDLGKVYYLDHEEYLYDRESDQAEGLYLVAESFTSFICNLRVDPDSN